MFSVHLLIRSVYYQDTVRILIDFNMSTSIVDNVFLCLLTQYWAFSDFRTGRVISKANDPTSNASEFGTSFYIYIYICHALLLSSVKLFIGGKSTRVVCIEHYESKKWEIQETTIPVSS